MDRCKYENNTTFEKCQDLSAVDWCKYHICSCPNRYSVTGSIEGYDGKEGE